jgi:hypothetical protein
MHRSHRNKFEASQQLLYRCALGALTKALTVGACAERAMLHRTYLAGYIHTPETPCGAMTPPELHLHARRGRAPATPHTTCTAPGRTYAIAKKLAPVDTALVYWCASSHQARRRALARQVRKRLSWHRRPVTCQSGALPEGKKKPTKLARVQRTGRQSQAGKSGPVARPRGAPRQIWRGALGGGEQLISTAELRKQNNRSQHSSGRPSSFTAPATSPRPPGAHAPVARHCALSGLAREAGAPAC